MVVNDFHIISVAFAPPETNSPLLVDPDAILSFPITSQGFQLVAGWHSKRVERDSGVKHIEFAQGHTLDCFETATFACPFQRFGVAASISQNHSLSQISVCNYIIFRVKRKAFTLFA
jgi:hypothetical protein